jgi:hypothetical protein
MAGRPRTPTNILKIRGAGKAYPARMKEWENEPVNVNPIGDAPEWLNEAELKAWALIVDKCIDGILGEADYLAVAIASQIAARCIAGEATHQDETLALRYLGQFGMTPTERTKVAVPKKKDKNPFDDDPLPKTRMVFHKGEMVEKTFD